MSQITARRAIGLALASAIVIGSAPIAAAHDRDNDNDHRDYKTWKRVDRNDNYYRSPNYYYPTYRVYRNDVKYRTVTYVPAHCRKRVISGRTFYYDDYTGYHYRYSPERRAYFVVNPVDLASFIKETFF